ncbi:hypothetical protein [Neisseria elongata]|uniref:hypothetical protein n=1 Tax=Neisseria elongata TaxID=495 RepID=UPI0028EA5619|nr:hypothetical protein [Neisseria elongata]
MDILILAYGVMKTNPAVGVMGVIVILYVASLIKYILGKKTEKVKWGRVSVFPVLIMAVIFGLGVKREQVEYAGLQDSLVKAVELSCKSDALNKCISADDVDVVGIYMATR